MLKQLVAYVGRENFLDGVRKYFAAHAWGNATLADLLAALEETSGRDLASWSAQWLQQAGVNTLRPSYQVDADGRFTEFAVEQEAAASHPVLRSHRIAIGLYDRTAAGIVRRQRVETDVAGARTVIGELAGQPRPDLVLVNDEDLTYAKIRLDDHSLRTLVDSIADITDSLPAALCWSAAWDMCRDGEMAARDYVRLVLSGIVLGGRHQRGADPAAAGQPGGAPAGRPRLAGDRAGPDGQRAAGPAGRALRPARTSSSPTSGPSPGWPRAPRTWPCWPGCSTARRRSTASPSTPTCAGPCCPGWSAGAPTGSARSGSRRSSTGTPPTRASGTPRHAARPSPPPRPSRRPGTRWSRASRPWPRSAPPCPGSSTWTSRR